MSLAAKLPWTHRFAGGFSGIGSQPLPTDADAIDYLSRMATADGAGVETSVATAVDAFVADSKALGVWDAMRASCILAGARTLAGALVPLKNEGPELWDGTVTPAISNDSGSAGVWSSSTQTASSSAVGTNNTFPRFKFAIGLTAGKQYRITARLTTTAANSLRYIRMGYTTLVPFSEVSNVIEIDRTATVTGSPEFEIDLDATVPGVAVTIESLSIREVIAAPTNVADGFVEGDFSRTAGLTGDGATTYLDSGRDNNDDPQNDQHVAVYSTTIASGNDSLLGADNVETGATVLQKNGGRCRSTTFSASALTPAAGFAGFSRNAGSSYHFRTNGENEETSISSQSPGGSSLLVFARDTDPVSAFSDPTMAFYSIGTSLGSNPADGLADLDTAVTNLINRLKFALLVGENPSGLDPDTIDYIVRGYEAGGTLE
jgi:hypothetical protein